MLRLRFLHYTLASHITQEEVAHPLDPSPVTLSHTSMFKAQSVALTILSARPSCNGACKPRLTDNLVIWIRCASEHCVYLYVLDADGGSVCIYMCTTVMQGGVCIV
jgi:hypothetical protein